MLVHHKLWMSTTDMARDADATVSYAHHDPAHPIDLSATGRHDAARRVGPMLDCVLAKLANRHQDRVADDRGVVEVVNEGLQHRVSQEIDLRQLDEPSRSNNDLGVILGKGVGNAADGLSEAKGTKQSLRRSIAWLHKGNTAPRRLLPVDPQCKPGRKQGVEAVQIGRIQSNIGAVLGIGIELRGVAVVSYPCSP